jgi:hypothetical protein
MGPFSRTLDTSDDRYFATCNIFYRRTDLEAVGGFDHGFRGAGEDTDLGYRVKAIGRRSMFCPEALVHHDVRPSSVSATLRDTGRWIGIPRLVKRNAQVARADHLYKRYFWRAAHPPVILATLGLAAALVFPPALLLTLPYLKLRLKDAPRSWSRVGRFLVLPGSYVVDMYEVIVMVRGSLRYGTVVL